MPKTRAFSISRVQKTGEVSLLIGEMEHLIIMDVEAIAINWWFTEMEAGICTIWRRTRGSCEASRESGIRYGLGRPGKTAFGANGRD